MLIFLVVSFTSSKSYAISDTLKQVTYGVEIGYHFSDIPKRLSSFFVVKPNANYWGVHGFAEFQVLTRMRFSTGIGFSRFSYSNLNNNEFNANLPQPDSAQHRNIYLVSSKELMVSPTVTCRFDYVLNPKIYFILGLHPQFRLTSDESNVYVGTYINGRDDGPFILENPDPAPIYNENKLILAGEMGVGIEVKNIALEFSFRNRNSFLLNFWGFRLRYKI